MVALILIASFVIQFPHTASFFTVLGNVRDTEGRVVPAVRVSLVDENQQPKGSVFADSSGRYQFRGVRAGTYFLRVEVSGSPFEEYSQQIDLVTLSPRASPYDEPMLFDIVLKRRKTQGDATKSASGVVFVQDVPRDAREQFNLASNSVKAKKTEAAIEELKKAIEMFPDYFAALDLLGSELVKQNQFEDAVPYLMRAVSINKRAATSMYALGVAHLKLENNAEAIQWLETASNEDPANPNVFMMLGIAYGNIQADNQAEEALKKAYRLGQARAADSHLYLAGIYDKLKRYGEAWRELELYLKEAAEVKDKSQVVDLISRLKEKEKKQQQANPE